MIGDEAKSSSTSEQSELVKMRVKSSSLYSLARATAKGEKDF